MSKRRPAKRAPAKTSASPELPDAPRFLRALLDNLPGVAYRCRNDRDWTMEFVSDGVKSLTGYSPAEFLSGTVTFGAVIVPEDRDRVWDEVQDALRDGRAYELQYSLATREGERQQVWERGRGVFAPDGELSALEGFITDVTALRRAEAQVLLLERRLADAHRMEAIGRLAGGVAHDFNNLLTAIQGYGEILLGDLPESDPHRGEVAEILKAAERAAALTQQLLAFSRRQLLKPRVVELDAVLDDMWPMLKRVISESIDLVRQSAADSCRVRADPGQLGQVIMNLVLNARDAMPAGGRLAIATGCRTVDTRFEAGDVVEPGCYSTLSVSDTGIGMDQETRERVFEPFFTTKGLGTGLGLSTVYGIVKQSQGYVVVASERGKGSTFEVLLPAVDASAVEAEPPAVPAQPGRPASAAAGRRTILLVEDEEAVRRLSSRILRREGYEVLEAADGAAALEVADGHTGPMDLLLTDVVMPRMGGKEAAERLLLKRPNLKVLFMSAYARDELGAHGLTAPGLVLLQKPFEIGDLLAKVAALLRGPA